MVSGSPSHPKKPMSVGSGLAAYLGVSALAGVLVAGLALPVVGTGASAANSSVGFFDSLPGDMDIGSMSQQSRLLYRDGSTMATFYYENRVLVPLSNVAPIMRQAVIAIEDWRFYEHSGADPRGIIRAAVNNALGRDTQGASTLTQQWIRNVLLDQARSAGDEEEIRRLLTPDEGRKVREIKLAIAAEKEYTKDQILENYLNIALFGNNQYGVQTASQRYLSKNADALNLQDAALLAGMIQSPSRYDPIRHPQIAQERRNTVLKRMLVLKIITQEQYDKAAAIPVAQQIKPTKPSNGCSQAGSAAFFCDYVTRIISSDPAFGENAAERQRLLYRGGLTIQTTLDRQKQEAAYNSVTQAVEPSDPSGAAASLVSVQPGTGRIVAMTQNRAYDPRTNAPPGTTAINYNVDAAHGGGNGFQTGSTFKPFTLATWLESGHTLTELVNANQIGYPMRSFKTSCTQLGGPVYRPGNSEGRDAGYISALQATYNSVNTGYVNMASKLDLCKIRDTANKLGVERADGQDITVTPAMVLGTNEIAPLTMANAFATFAADGKYCTPVAIEKTTTPDGMELKKPAAECKEVLSPNTASGVNAALQQVVQRGTGRRLGIGRPAAGKTGTTNDSWETWFVGYTPRQLSTAVWVGTPDPSPKSLRRLRINGVYRSMVYGATIAGPAWQRYMREALQGTEVTHFSKATQNWDLVERAKVPWVNGQPRDVAIGRLAKSGFPSYVAGEEHNDSVPPGHVIRTTPTGGSTTRVGRSVGLYISRGPQASPSPSENGEDDGDGNGGGNGDDENRGDNGSDENRGDNDQRPGGGGNEDD
ncbi:MAG: glycosyl transferase [Micrococcales bacterium]|nr:MAG: glycosyl transferase [Micrococcales bacterium]